jgi:hypothetical protein
MLLGIIPLYGSPILYLNPSIVCVFPVPVCPYAKIVALYPSNTEMTLYLAVFSYTNSYVLLSSYT